ncbi:MAG: hypothetical protein PHU81_01005 [Acidobacteriota bacterium]|nr:hypothetical protein [Acidobacteriota bacterium]
MEEKKYVSQLPGVQAPAGFESQVLERLKEKKARAVHRRRWEWGFTGAVAAALLVAVLLSPHLKQPEYSARQVKADNSPVETIRVLEPLNLENEMLRATDEPQTLFILEKVSDHGLIHQARY